jgi:hypothetical protein
VRRYERVYEGREEGRNECMDVYGRKKRKEEDTRI